MADESGLSPFVFACQGGLVLDQSTFVMQPGTALELENFEPDVQGGYRRISGYKKWSLGEVPYTFSSSEKVLMSAYFKGEILAARGESIYTASNSIAVLDGAILSTDTTINVIATTGFSSTGTLLIGTEQITYTGITATSFTGCTRGVNSTLAVGYPASTQVNSFWTSIDSGRTNANKYTFFRYSLAGVDYIVWTDGANYATKYDGTTITNLNVTNAPVDAKYVTGFKNALFFAGMSSSPEEVIFTAPYTDSDFNVVNGAGSISVDSTITAIVPFREQLYIFCEDRIFRLTGNSAADFVLQPVSREIGCLNGFTVQEFGGDLVYLGPDGLRTVAGTDRIGDVELGTISRQIQERFTGLINVSEFDSVVIPDKTQYRLFFSAPAETRQATKGIVCVRKGDAYEFADLKGIRPSCTDYIIQQGESYIIHGGYDGYVYRQEQGFDFDGNTVTGKYRSPDLTMGDAGIRKSFQRVILNYAPESIVNADLFVRYDYESPNTPRPAAYPFDTTTAVAIYGSSVFGTATYGGQSNPLVRQPIEGSGFAIALRVNDRGTSAPYSLKGFQLEFEAAARR